MMIIWMMIMGWSLNRRSLSRQLTPRPGAGPFAGTAARRCFGVRNGPSGRQVYPHGVEKKHLEMRYLLDIR